MKSILSFMVIFLIINTAQAETNEKGYNLYFIANNTCAKFLKTRKEFFEDKNNPSKALEYSGYLNFTAGYLTASSILVKRLSHLNSKKIELNLAMFYLNKHCTKKPDYLITDIINTLSVDLTLSNY